MPEREALFYDKLPDFNVKCKLCPHHCRLSKGQTGLCGTRDNQEGRLIAANFGKIAAFALDPIEKKPLYHFYPGKYILSAGTFGCNFSCSFCQNHQNAQEKPEVTYIDPEKLVQLADRYRSEDSIGIAFTYNEPSIWYEYILETAPRLKELGLKTVLVSNGFIEKKPLEQLIPYIDAVNIDVKAFSDSFYRKFCRGKLNVIKDNVEYFNSRTHIEITTLLIEGQNDSLKEIEALSRWLSSLNTDIPLHFSRYYPAYKLDQPATSESVLFKCCEIAREYLPFVYIGNLSGRQNDTICKYCGNLLIRRNDYAVKVLGIEKGQCSKCSRQTDYIIDK